MLLAVGRRPNTDDLGLDKAGVAVDERGYIVVDDQLRTNVPGIWALGDCNGKGAFTHTSYNDFEIVAANLLDNDPRRVSDRITAYALYIDPPLGRAGMTEAEVRKSGRKALVGKRPMTRVGRAVEKGETQGFMKIVVDAETQRDPRRRDPRHRRRRGDPLDPRRDVREGAVDGDAARDAHSSDRLGARPDDAVRAPADGLYGRMKRMAGTASVVGMAPVSGSAGRGFGEGQVRTRDAPAPRRVLPNAPRVTRCSCG